MRIVVSGGGTAGHITPILALVDALRSLDSQVEILYIGQSSGMEAKIAAGAGIEFEAIRSGKFRRHQGDVGRIQKLISQASVIGPNTIDLTRVVSGLTASIRILRRWKPEVVFIKGGYVGLPVGIAASILHIPYVIHESDVAPGLTNRILSRRAQVVAVGFPTSYYHDLPHDKLVYTGSPVRRELMGSHRLEGLAAFKLTGDLPVLLVTGGSQGAQGINDVVVDALPELVKVCQIVHLTGELEIERIKFEVKRIGKFEHSARYQAHAFLGTNMGLALAAADLVISRAGANTIAELAMLCKPTILIPNAAMAGHQVATARLMARHGAARVLEERTLTPERLIKEVNAVLANEAEQKFLSDAIGSLAMPKAAEELANIVIEAASIARAADTNA